MSFHLIIQPALLNGTGTKPRLQESEKGPRLQLHRKTNDFAKDLFLWRDNMAAAIFQRSQKELWLVWLRLCVIRFSAPHRYSSMEQIRFSLPKYIHSHRLFITGLYFYFNASTLLRWPKGFAHLTQTSPSISMDIAALTVSGLKLR